MLAHNNTQRKTHLFMQKIAKRCVFGVGGEGGI